MPTPVATTELTLNVEDLRDRWSEAVAEDGPGVNANEVLNRLELRYRKMADAAESVRKCG